MKIISATTRITVGLLCLGISVWLVAFALGMFPDRQGAIIDSRAALCENVALHCSLLASRDDRRAMEASLRGLVRGNRSIESAALRRPDGGLAVSVGPHAGQWRLPSGTQSTPTQMRVPILAGDTEWGSVEIRFRDRSAGAIAWLRQPLVVWAVFLTAATYLLYSVYLNKMLKHLDPARVIPRRVRDTLDTLAEGLLVLDKNERILLANEAFAESIGATVTELTGRKASDLPWESDANRLKLDSYPWQRALQGDASLPGDLLAIHDHHRRRRVLQVSATPVKSEDGAQRGAMASFNDVTEIELNREEMRQMLRSLSESRDEIHRQNLELERLASRDPLTGCLNRRAFFTELDHHWSEAARDNTPLACIMVDLDHFKSINDTYGHATGDQVLEAAARLLCSGRRPADLVCRYGGEEFCLLLPEIELEEAFAAGEQIREAFLAADFDGVVVTASIGVSARSLGAREPQSLIDQADKSLYVAKGSGRNRVVRFDHAADEERELSPATGPDADGRIRDGQPPSAIPFHAVTALVSALAYRDPSTADHSRRVADLCVATARRLIPASQSYILEIAALLHDIGKIGVPDLILLKPDKLNDEEWRVMDSHEQMGAEIVRATFSSPKLAEIICTYRSWYGGRPLQPDLPAGDQIPLPARILAISDAYDSMTNRTPFREPLSRQQAVAELRRCAPTQFDPQLVESFVNVLNDFQSGETTPRLDASKAAALSFGAQVERLADAIEHQDRSGIATLARRLNLSAVKCGASEIADAASRLDASASQNSDLDQLLKLTTELLDLCRSTQRAYLNEAVGFSGAAN